MAEGGGCRDERRGSSASEVGTDDGKAKKKKKKEDTAGTKPRHTDRHRYKLFHYMPYPFLNFVIAA